MALGITQIGWQFARKLPIDTMQWMSLFLVLGSGAATLLTHDPRFVMVKPSVIYLIVGIVMLKPGWMNRYLPPVAIEIVPDIAVIFGYVWAGLMFFSAALNLLVALNFSVVTWSASMSIYAIVSKAVLFLIQYATMRTIGVRRRRAQMIPAAFLTNFREPLRLRTRSARGQARPLRPPVNRASCDVERRPNSANATLTGHPQ